MKNENSHIIIILVDGRTIKPNPSGVGNVVYNLLKQITRYKNLKIIVFTKKGVKEIPGLKKIIVEETNFDYQFVGIKRFLFEQIILPKIIYKYKPHILHMTDSFGVPLLIPKDLKVIITLHDLIPFTSYRELMNGFSFFLYKLSILFSLHRANKIGCVSKFTQKDLLRFLPKIKKEKTIVIYNGINKPKLINSFKTKNILQKYGITDKYIFYIGGFSPRKNVLKVIKSFQIFLEQNKNRKYQLVLSGRISQAKKEIKNNIKKINNYLVSKKLFGQVLLLDYISSEEKIILLKNALFLVYLSLYEGFGLPVLEALSCGTPVITSKDSAMEEIAGNYALFADPKNEKNIYQKMTEIIENYSYYKKISNEARIKLIPRFNWKKNCKLYYKLYQSSLN